mgnify:CR=1 FL=1
MFNYLKRQKKVGLALGGGSAKGFSHIGVIKVLKENNIPIDYIAGTSIGALIGGTFAALNDINKIEEIALKTNWREILPLLDPSIVNGLLSGEKLTRFIESQIGKINFSELDIPFTAVATDLETGNAVHINDGSVSEAIRASLSLPLVFKPVKHNKITLSDGGLSEPVPVKALREMGAEIIIAVNLLTHYSSQNRKSFSGLGFYNIASDSISILNHHLANHNTKDADIVVLPEVYNFGWKSILTSKSTEEVIMSGEKAMSEKIEALKNKLNKKIFW